MSPQIKRKLVTIKKKIPKKLPLLAGMVVVLIFLRFISISTNWLNRQGLTLSYFSSLIKDNPTPIIKEYKNRTNILFLGAAGGDHSGSKLTDTMIFISLDIKGDDVLIISLPRDIWSTNLQDKINSAYYYGEEKKPGGGFILAKSIAEEVVGQPVHYSVLVDFEGFKDIIDTLGGIEIDVLKKFSDHQYPVHGRENDDCDGDPDYSCRYETIKFNKGKQLMDGATALKYVRSRNAQGSQGSDFARSQRQQQIIIALKNKAADLRILANPIKLNKLYEQFNRSVKTDAQLSEALALAKIGSNLNKSSFRSVTLDEGDIEKERDGWLYNPPISKFGRWVLFPRDDSFSLLHNFIECHINSTECDMSPDDI